MTCIAVVRDVSTNKIWMAGDRGISDDNTINVGSSPKIWKKEGYLFGYAGSMDGDRIKHLFVPPDLCIVNFLKHYVNFMKNGG